MTNCGVAHFALPYCLRNCSPNIMILRLKTHWKRPWCKERLKAGGEGDDRGWDGWMASPTQWTWVWVNSGTWWWTGRPGLLQSMWSQRVRHDWATELNRTGSFSLLFLLPPWLFPLKLVKGVKVKVKSFSHVPTLCDPVDCSLPGSSVHGISRQEYWSGLPFPSPGDLPDPGIKPWSPTLQADTLTSEPPGKPC